MYKLRYRQIHLDFHTSPAIPGIGEAFDAKQWQQTLLDARVNSVTIFAVCHHGWSYYQTEVGKMHPHLNFDLSQAMYDACKTADINAQMYVTAGINNYVAHEHPEWRGISPGGWYTGWVTKPIEPGFHMLCFNTPYLDYLCKQIQEVATRFPKADGIWLDIIHKPECCCRWCLDGMKELGLDAVKQEDRVKYADIVLDNYYRRTLEALRAVHPTMPIFQNSGHVQRGERRFFNYVTHLELESLPTWGWGYDHFPMSAKYAKLSGLDFLGMTGKFHTTWGEFGGYKHPNALRYECAAMLAYGAKCSVGDQLPPSGQLDPATYSIIGKAYAEVEAKEPWCDDSVNVADIALLSSVAVNPAHPRDDDADIGAARILLEGHFLFDIIDGEMDFSRYKLLVLADEVIVNPSLKAKLDAYLAGGGKLLLTGKSGLDEQGVPLFDIGGVIEGVSPYSPDFIQPIPELTPAFAQAPFVAYTPSQRLRVTTGSTLGEVFDPYFNRTYEHFCSHQHAPAQLKPSGFDCGVQQGNVMYLAHPVFLLYRAYGAVVCKDFVLACLRRLLGDDQRFASNLPSTARVTLTEQPEQQRFVLHLLYANLINRGGSVRKPGSGLDASQSIEVIEELMPLHDVHCTLKVAAPIRCVTLEPQGAEIPFTVTGDRLSFAIDKFTCHQMVVLHK